MGRYRPPQPPSSAYITAAGHARLQAESKALWARRAEVTRALAAAAAEGDRSENAEYIYRKKELREIDRRIRYLQKRLPGLNVVTTPPEDTSRIFFGAWVTLEEMTGAVAHYRIVGPDEFDTEKGFISMDSPMARALIGKRAGDEVEVSLPAGKACYYVRAVSYRPPS